MKSVLALITLSFVLFACEKKEIPIPKYVRVEVVDTNSSTVGELQTAQLDMGVDYRTQFWFSLSENAIVHSNLKTAWDLGFESNTNGTHIMLNGSRAMKVLKTDATSMSQVNDTAGIGSGGRADMPSGRLDSTAFGDFSDGKVYIINRGYNESGQPTGFYKFKVLTNTSTEYTFEYGDIFGSQTFQGTVLKDNNYNFRGYSFSTHALAGSIEPDKTKYDLCFTIYTHLFVNPLMYYQVTGVLTNSYKTRAARVFNKEFNDIVLADTLGRYFSANRDAIGYDWKTFIYNTNLYSVDPKMCYIVMDSKGYYYKLHFIDFYNVSGVKGAPKFEFKRL